MSSTHRAGMSLSSALDSVREHVAEALGMPVPKAPEPFTGPRFIALASGPNRAIRRAAMSHTVGYPVQTGNRATRRAGARKAWRQAKIKEIREAHKNVVEEKSRA